MSTNTGTNSTREALGMTTTRQRAAAPAAADKQPQTFFDLLKKSEREIARALPKHMNADRMARIVMTNVRQTPKLLECDPKSVLGAVMQCAQLGLEPGGALGHAYLLPFERRAKRGGEWVTVSVDCQLIIGYRGMLDLARRSGQIQSISARAVYEHDEFSYEFGLHEDIRHVPHTGAKRGALLYVYAVAIFKDGGHQFDVMSRAQVEEVRASSKGGNKPGSPWVEHFEQMALKTVTRRLFKWLPVSIELQQAVSLDEAADRDAQDNAGFGGAILDGEFTTGSDAAAYITDGTAAAADDDGEIEAGQPLPADMFAAQGEKVEVKA